MWIVNQFSSNFLSMVLLELKFLLSYDLSLWVSSESTTFVFHFYCFGWLPQTVWRLFFSGGGWRLGMIFDLLSWEDSTQTAVWGWAGVIFSWKFFMMYIHLKNKNLFLVRITYHGIFSFFWMMDSTRVHMWTVSKNWQASEENTQRILLIFIHFSG